MRACPICGHSERGIVISPYHHPEWSMFYCGICGMRYLDSDKMSQADLNLYYQRDYHAADGPYSEARLNALAKAIAGLGLQWSVMDIGGKDGVLSGKIRDLGMKEVSVSDAGDDFGGKYAVIVMSHTLEHVYDVWGMLQKIKDHLKVPAWLVIEVPIWAADDNPLVYDPHWQHINKFTPADLERLLESQGFSIVSAGEIDPYLEYYCYRVIAKMEPMPL